MADEPKTPGRARATGAASRPAPDLSSLEADPTMAPVTENTPLPPLTPLPLVSPAAAGPATPPAQPAEWSASGDVPVLPPLPPANPVPPAAPVGASGIATQAPATRRDEPAISTTWAVQSMFVLVFTSVILLAAMAIAYAIAIKSGGLLVWAVVLIILLNLVYAAIVASIARPGLAQPLLRLPFLRPRRGP